MAEPLGVAFVEIEPVAVGFRAKTEAQLRSQLSGVSGGIRPSASTVAATRQVEGYGFAVSDATARLEALALAQSEEAAAAERTAGAETTAAAATRVHAAASREAAEAVLAQTASMTGLRGASIGVNPAFLAATAASIAFFKSADEADAFAEKMHLIEFATGASEEEMAKARETAKAYGRDLTLPATSADDAATAIQDLTHSGFDLAESEKVAKDALLLHSAANVDLGTSTEVITRLLRAYNLDADQASQVTDALTAATLSGAGSTEEYASALEGLAPLTHALGLSLQDTATLFIQSSHAGISAGNAATLLRLALTRLAGGSKQVVDGLEKINLNLADLRDNQGNLRPDALLVIGDAIRNLNQQQQGQALAAIFSARAGARLLPLITQTADQYDRAATQASKYGLTQQEAEARSRSLAGRERELKADLKDLGETLGEVTIGPLAGFVSGLADIASGMTAAGRNIASGVHAVESAIPGGRTAANVVGKAAVEFEKVASPIGFARTELHLFNDAASEIRGTTIDASEGVEKLFNAFAKSDRGKQATQDLITGLKGIREGLDATNPAGKKAIDTINRVIAQIQKGRKLPPVIAQFLVEFDEHQADLKARTAADHIADHFVDEIRRRREDARAAGTDLANAVTAGMEGTLTLARAQAAGDIPGQLAELNRELDVALRHQRAVDRRANAPGAGPGAVTAATNAANRVTDLKDRIRTLRSQIASDAASAASDAKQAADAIVTAQEKVDQAFVARIERRRAQREAAVSIASDTGDAAAEVRADVKLRNFLRNAIENVRARISQARAAGRATDALAAELDDLRRSRNQVRREIAALQQQAREQAVETRVESTQLDEQILETRIGDDPSTAQIRKLVNAHNRVIAALKKAQSLVRKGSVEWKRLQLEIEQERAAIRDLKKSRDGASKDTMSLQKQEFAFLQTIQGFSSNLLGNLIPGNATAGLVGGTATATEAMLTRSNASLAPVRPGGGNRATEAVRDRPVSAGQGNTQITLLREIRNLLKSGRLASDHPEVHHQRAKGAAIGDFHIQGTIGM